MTEATDTAPAPETTTEAPADNAQAVAEMTNQTPAEHGQQAEPIDYGFVLDKYKAEGRSDSDSAIEQAKAYGELQSKFGSFTGAPEEYEMALSEGLAEHVNLEDYKDDPLMNDYKELAKEMGINNEGFNKFVEMHFKQQIADSEAMDTVRAEEMKALGPDAERRLENVSDWAKFNLDAAQGDALSSMLTSASAVGAIEALIAKTRNVQQTAQQPSAPAITHEQIQEMMFAKDQYGNPKMNQPEYRAEVDKMYEQRFGKGVGASTAR